MKNNYLEVPVSNSIPFVKVEDADNLIIFNNDSNLFSFENQNKISYASNFIYEKKDIPSLQIKSNFDNIQAFLRKEDETEEEIFLLKKSNNLDKFQKMDCIAYPHSSGRLAIYFETGDYYDENNVVLSSYSLNGNLPEFAKIGNYVQIDSLGFHEIISILIDTDINKKIIIFDQAYAIGGNTLTIISSTYNLLDFEVYEYYFNFNEKEEGYYDVHIKASSSDQQKEENLLSENFLIQEKHENTQSISYYNNDNRDMFYFYKIRNNLRVLFSEIERYVKQESEINIDDDNAQIIKSFLNFGYNFIVEDLTQKEADILLVAICSENVFINGFGYIKDGEPSLEKTERTNIYKLDFKMIKTNIKLNQSSIRFQLIDLLIPSTIPNI
tara:strand:+ start:295 stop:1443 length:1149 start_codon:yes stop_codon:yes gene_type:complete